MLLLLLMMIGAAECTIISELRMLFSEEMTRKEIRESIFQAMTSNIRLSEKIPVSLNREIRALLSR